MWSRGTHDDLVTCHPSQAIYIIQAYRVLTGQGDNAHTARGADMVTLSLILVENFMFSTCSTCDKNMMEQDKNIEMIY